MKGRSALPNRPARAATGAVVMLASLLAACSGGSLNGTTVTDLLTSNAYAVSGGDVTVSIPGHSGVVLAQCAAHSGDCGPAVPLDVLAVRGQRLRRLLQAPAQAGKDPGRVDIGA